MNILYIRIKNQQSSRVHVFPHLNAGKCNIFDQKRKKHFSKSAFTRSVAHNTSATPLPLTSDCQFSFCLELHLNHITIRLYLYFCFSDHLPSNVTISVDLILSQSQQSQSWTWHGLKVKWHSIYASSY